MTRDQKIYRLTYWIACFILAGTFLSSAYIKIIDPAAFEAALADYRLLPGVLVKPAAWIITWLEAVCGVLLLAVSRMRKPALWTVLGLLIIFSGAIIINLIRGSAISCGCFSSAPDAQPMNWISVARNGMLMGLVGLAFLADKRSRQDAGGTAV